MKRRQLLLASLLILAIGCERPKPPSAKPASLKAEPAKDVKPEIRYYAFKG